MERAGLVGQSVVLSGLQEVHVCATAGDAWKIDRRVRVVRRVFVVISGIFPDGYRTKGVTARSWRRKGRNGRCNGAPDGAWYRNARTMDC